MNGFLIGAKRLAVGSVVAVGLLLVSPDELLAQSGETIEYIHTDALGSPVAVTNAAGEVIERTVYDPYGGVVNRPLSDVPGYTGHVTDASTGLSYMQQRYYDPEVGAFLSVDPVSANRGGAHFNRYRYANGNAYKLIDPDGRQACGKNSTCAIKQGARGGSVVVSARMERSESYAARVGKLATDAANQALSSLSGKEFKTASAAARAWVGKVRAVSDRFDTEIASKLFHVDGGIAIGTATSDGLRYGVNPDFSTGPTRITAGYVHTHPTNSLFSKNDLNYAINMFQSLNGENSWAGYESSAFVSLPNGRLLEWKASEYNPTQGASYMNPDYYYDR